MKQLLIIVSVLLLVGAVSAPAVTEALDASHLQTTEGISNSLSPGPAYWEGGHKAAQSGIIILSSPPLPMPTANGIRPWVFFVTVPRETHGSPGAVQKEAPANEIQPEAGSLQSP